MIIFLRLVLASLVADFVLQPGALVEWKKRHPAGLLAHSSVVLVVSLLVGVGYWSARYLACVTLLALLHLGIDWLKTVVDRAKPQGFWSLGTFLADQVLHIILTGAVLIGFRYWAPVGTQAFLRRAADDPRLLTTAVVYLAAVLGGSVVVRLVVQAFHVEPRSERRPGLLRAGAYIGMVERLLITALVAQGQFAAVGFVLAAKSIARYKELDDAAFAEYYLIGTLTSATIAVLSGMVLSTLTTRPLSLRP